jgi:hypothetical protein
MDVSPERSRIRLAAAFVAPAVGIVFAFLLSSDLTPSLGHLPDAAHIAGHVAIFGIMAAALLPWTGAHGALGAVMAAGLGLELVQAYAVGLLFVDEALFDLGVDLVSGALGLVLTRDRAAADALGGWLHPALVGPAALYGIGRTVLGGRADGLAFAGLVLVCFAPAVAAWLGGVAVGWFESIELRERARRPPLFLVAVVCSVASWRAVVAVWPGPLESVAFGVVLAVVAVTAITTAGFKISGHVGGAVLSAVAVAPWSQRGAVVLVGAGLALSWARVRARCHTPREVVGAWLLALAFALLGSAR